MSVLFPIILIIISLGAIVFILYRKLDYIQKLSPEVINDNKMVKDGFLSAYFSELIFYIQKLNLREQAIRILSDVVKLLRSCKIFFLKIERYTGELIRAIQVAVREQEEQLARSRVEDASFKSGPVLVNEVEVDEIVQQSSVDFKASPAEKLTADHVYKPSSIIQKQGHILKQGDNPNMGINDPVSSYKMPQRGAVTDNPYGTVVMISPDEDILSELRRQEQLIILSIAKNPRDASLYKQLGDIYTQTEELQDARASYERALKLDPEDYIIKTKLAKVLRRLEQIV